MDRRNFFKNITAASVGIAIFPGVVIKAFSTHPGFNIKKLDERIEQIRREWCIKQAKEMYRQHLLQYPLTYNECFKKYE